MSVENDPESRGFELRWGGLIAGVAVFALIAFVPSDLHRLEGYGHRPAYAAATAALMAAWWLTEALPINWTACLPLVLFPALGVFGQGPLGDVRASVEPYFDAYIFLFLGGMAVGAAMEQWGLHRRIALTIMRAIGTDPKRLLLGMLVATASVSLWISNTATAVMMLPIGLALLRQVEEARGKRPQQFGNAIMLSIAYGSNVGGMGTKIGTGPNSIFSGYVSEQLGREVSFVGFIGLALPLVMILLPIVWLALWRIARHDSLEGMKGREVIDEELAAMGRMSRGEKVVAAVFLVAAALWVFGDPIRPVLARVISELAPGVRLQIKHYEAGVAMTAALFLMAVRALSFASLRRIPWGALVLLGGSFSMAAGIEGSGLAKWMASEMRAITELSLFAQVAVATFASIGLSAIASNTATINVMLNLLPRSMTVLFASTMACSCDFALPAGTPPNAIVFGSGYVRLPTMMKVGALLDVVAAVVITLYVLAYVAPWLG